METKIAWKQTAVTQFAEAIKYIEKESPLSAEKFKKEILKKINNLIFQPERYPPDKFKNDNDGSYRAFEIFNYRISYRFISKQIRILRIRHTKWTPLIY